MNHLTMELLIVGILAVFAFKIEFVVPLKNFNDEHLSVKSISMLKGLFAIVILYHHLAQKTTDGIVFRQFKNVGYLAVAFFFFLSGYGLQKKYMADENYSEQFLLRRLPAVLIPYAITTAIYWLAHAVQGRIYSLKDIIFAIWNGSPIVNYSWYIIHILIFYFVFWILMRVCKKHYAVMVIGASVYYVIWALICRKLSYGSWWYTSTHLLAAGMFWALEEKNLDTVLKKHYFSITPILWAAFFAVFLSSGFSGIMQAFVHIRVDSFLNTIAAILFVLSVILFTMKFRIGNRMLNFLGSISFEIYMIQGLYISVLKYSCARINNQFLWCCAVIMCTIISAVFLHKLFQFILSKYEALLP